MISTQHFVDYLKKKNFRFFTGVPCSFFKDVIRYIEDQNDCHYIIAPNEGAALATASGAILAGRPSVVMIQNSGLGNLINPLTSLNLIYEIPAMLFISGRAYGISDEPQHQIMGKKMEDLLKALDISFWTLPENEASCFQVIEEGIHELAEKKRPVVFLVRKNTFSPYKVDTVLSSLPMKRIEAISCISELIKADDLVFSTTGMPSRELFTVFDRPGNFYMQGSMGHIGAVALGTALAHPDRRVIVLDGDGAFLMHMGNVSMIGHYQPHNFYHFVLDNESYETTGNQPTTSRSTNFETVAKACGYHFTAQVQNKDELNKIFEEVFSKKGPCLIRVKINCDQTHEIPRITTKYQAPQIAQSFAQALTSTSIR